LYLSVEHGELAHHDQNTKHALAMCVICFATFWAPSPTLHKLRDELARDFLAIPLMSLPLSGGE
jgi:hypothetical protein